MAVITGDDKGNKLEGTSDPDLIQGNGGNDELSGLGSDDQLDPGPGRDQGPWRPRQRHAPPPRGDAGIAGRR